MQFSTMLLRTDFVQNLPKVNITVYSRPSLIRTAPYLIQCLTVWISEFVWISEILSEIVLWPITSTHVVEYKMFPIDRGWLLCHLQLRSSGPSPSSFDQLTTSQTRLLPRHYNGLKLLKMVWSCEAGHHESFGLVLRISEVRVNKGLLYLSIIRLLFTDSDPCIPPS